MEENKSFSIQKLDSKEISWRFPPPPPDNSPMLAVVVRKIESLNIDNEKQNEIYVYSPRIIAGSGLMMMPKDNFKVYKLGDWVSCEREWNECLKSNYQEISLTNIELISSKCMTFNNVPPTMVHNKSVFISENFVVCPKFIKNRKIQSYNSTFLKLLIYNFGQAFVDLDSPLTKKLEDEYVYRGMFEFQGEAEGGVNFATDDLDQTDVNGHPVERDCLWRLVDLLPLKIVQNMPIMRKISIDKHDEMKNYLYYLKKWAIEYANKYEPRKAGNSKKDQRLFLKPIEVESDENLQPSSPEYTEKEIIEKSKLKQKTTKSFNLEFIEDDCWW